MPEAPRVTIRLSVDRCAFGAPLPSWVEGEIRRRRLVTVNGDMVSFCGLVARSDEIYVFLPRGSQLSLTGGDTVGLAALLTGCVELYARRGGGTQETGELGDEGFEGRDRLAVIRELLEDYRLNGPYSTVSRYRTVNTGKTDWKRTINRVTPFPDRHGVPVYPLLLGTRNRHAADSIVAMIHLSVIARLDQMFGWWITGHPSGRIAAGLAETEGLLARRSYCLAMLRRERASVYSDRNVRLIGNLLSYLEDSVGDTTSPVVIGLRDFHWAWEHMLGEVLSHRSKVAQEFPVPVYYSSGGLRTAVTRKGMRTDIVLERNTDKRAVVVDAKYYSASSAGDAPGWHDLVKQFFYAKALRTVRPGWHVGNVFIFPGRIGPLEAAHVESRDGTRRFDADFPRIQCLYADPVVVMRHYLALQHSETLTAKVLQSAKIDRADHLESSEIGQSPSSM